MFQMFEGCLGNQGYESSAEPSVSSTSEEPRAGGSGSGSRTRVKRPFERRERFSMRLSSLLKHPVFHNTMALYGIHGAGLLLPLITFPYLSRVLGPESLGQVIFAQSFSLMLSIFVEYGFTFSATKRIAQHRDQPERIGELAAEVLGARALLCLLSGVLVSAMFFVITTFRDQPPFLIYAWLHGVALGVSPSWYFQGVERLRGAAAIDIAGRCVGVLLIFALVRTPDDGEIVLLLKGLGILGAAVINNCRLYRTVAFRVPTSCQVLAGLRWGASMFFYRGTTNIWTAGNSFILGLLLAAEEVAFFAGADKLVRAAAGLFIPLTQALFPRLNSLMARDMKRFTRAVRYSLLLNAVLGSCVSGIVVLGAPVLIRVLLGPGYERSVSVVYALGLLPLFTALKAVFGIQWMIPLGYEKTFVFVVAAGGVLNVILALTLATSLRAVGMGIAVAASHAAAILTMVCLSIPKFLDLTERTRREGGGVEF